VRKNFEGLLTQTEAEAISTVTQAKLQMDINAVKTRLEAAVAEMLTVEKAEALNSRVNQDIGERVRAVVTKVLEKHATALTQAIGKDEFNTQMEALRATLKKELAEVAPKGLENILKKSELEAALWQVQTVFGERMQKLVSAEAFEARLMTSSNMLCEAQAKAIQDAVAAIQTTLEKRLSETTTPIYQRVSSLITFNDWERVSRETSEQLLKTLTQQVGSGVESALDGLQKKQNENSAVLHRHAEAAVTKIEGLRAYVETVSGNSTAMMNEGLKNIGERLALLMIETAEKQKLAVQTFQKETIAQQTQTLGALSVQQQNFMSGLQRDWELLNKTMGELKGRCEAIEKQNESLSAVVKSVSGAMTMVVEQLKSFEETNKQLRNNLPQVLQTFEQQMHSRLREQAQLYQAELSAFEHKMEAGVAEVISKKLKTLKLTAE
jgi:hypothetical protein